MRGIVVTGAGLMVAALAWAGIASAQAPTGGSIRAFDPDSYDVSGMGELEFDATDAEVVKLAPALEAVSGWFLKKGVERPDTAIVYLKIDRAGGVKDCNSAVAAPEPVKAMCHQFMSKARFRFTSAPEVQFNTGILAIAVAARKVVPIELPPRLVARDSGVQFFVGESKDQGCIAVGPGSDAAAKAVCKAWQAAGKPGERLDGGFVSAVVTVAPDPKGKIVYEVGKLDLPATRGPIYLAPDLGAPGEKLTSADGRLDAHLEYPTRALRYELAGRVTIWLGISRDGKPRSCHPVYSEDGALLATETCSGLMRTSKFQFAPGASSYEGVRYLGVPVVWAVD